MLPGAFLPAVPAIKVVDVGAMWIGGDGTRRRLHICNEAMTSSLFEPNTPLLAAFDDLEQLVRVVREVPVDTHRLDDVPDASRHQRPDGPG